MAFVNRVLAAIANKKRVKVDTYEQAEKVRKDYEKQQEYVKNKQRIKFLESQNKYAQSRSGRLGRTIAKGFALGRRGGVTRALYQRSGQLPPVNMTTPKDISQMDRRYKSRQTFRGNSMGRRGRPFGTVKYRDENGNPIGVYEYRKLLSAKIRMQRMEALRRVSVNPQQQAIFQQIQQREAMRRNNPENKTIPDTQGNVFLADIMGDIDRSANLVD